ncbi:MAG TPA: Ppx/GppA family phosphatase, partial [Novosphingobium sp.]|nr:Ppx/GppA family phosphatase [Novosphingobium sp.]
MMALWGNRDSGRASAGHASGEHAIIDIGSNTVRLVIYDGPPRAPTVLYNEKVTARLGKGVADNGLLAEKGSALALSALGRFAAILRLRAVADVQCVATAAVRDAGNGGAFLKDVAALGLNPRLLSGEEEALTSARGIISAFPGARGIVGDLGGGSLELVDVADGTCTHGTSLPLGTLRLPGLRADGPARFTRRIDKMLRATEWIGQHDQPFYLVGGSFRALARLAMARQEWPVDDPHGFEMAPDAALHLARSVASTAPAFAKPVAGRGAGKAAVGLVPGFAVDPQLLGISAGRLASLPDAAALLGVLVRELKPSVLVFSGWGLREGLLAGRLDARTAAS